jgi:hypothetical protein
MIYREAILADIEQIQLVRNSVKENTLSDPSVVTNNDCKNHLTKYGKGWVCESNGKLVGFAIVNLEKNNIWALFVRPEHEAMGIGKTLQRTMLDWYFDQTNKTVWLGTSPETRAEKFYAKQGWKATGVVNKGEVKFEMSNDDWEKLKFR